MTNELGTKNVHQLLWSLSIPAILGMLSSAIFNIVDRIFVGKISAYALTAVGITMPIQVLQMAFILLIGIGTSALISIKLGEGKKEEAEDILYLAFKYIMIFLVIFAVLFVVFLNPILRLLSISETVLPYAKTYIVILTVGAIVGIPGYCLNNSLRSIGQAKTSMKIIILTSILNIILDPIFIFVFHMGIAGAAIATVLSQMTLTIYVVLAFCKRKDFMIHLSRRKVTGELSLLRESLKMGMPSFFVQLLATVVNVFVNWTLLHYGTDLDFSAVTIMSTIFSFYHMVVVGIVQGNNAICGYNYGARQYERVRASLRYALLYAALLSILLFVGIECFPEGIVRPFSKDPELIHTATSGMRFYFLMLPLVGLQTVSSQYFQCVGKSTKSSVLSFLRYGVILVPAALILAPVYGATGLYIGNAISDGIASIIALICIVLEIHRLGRQ